MLTLMTTDPNIDSRTFNQQGHAIITWMSEDEQPNAIVFTPHRTFQTQLSVNEMSLFQQAALYYLLTNGNYAANWCEGRVEVYHLV